MPAFRRPRPNHRTSAVDRRSGRLRAFAVLLLALAAMLVPAQSAFAEGSLDLDVGPGTALRNRLVAGGGSTGPGYGGYTVLRAYARAGETIDMGSSAMGIGGSGDILVYAPGTSFASGTEPSRRATIPADPIFATDVFSCVADDPGTGRIAGRAEEQNGPLPNVGGYTPCSYVAPADGVYAIVMVPYAVGGSVSGLASTVNSPTTLTEQGAAISIWDVTVRDAAGVEQPGRVFTNIFEFLVPTAAATVSNLSTFVYTPAGYVYHVTIFNPRSKAWDLAVNGSGVVDATTGEPISASFRWGPTSGYPPTLEPTYGDSLAPQMWEGDAAGDSRYPMFFRTPDPVVFSGPGGLAETRGYSATPIAPEGGLTSLLSFAGESGEAGSTVQGSGGTVAIDAPQLGEADYDVTLDLDRDGTFGGGKDVELAGTLSGVGSTTAGWDGRDATGAVVPCGVGYDYRVTSTLPAVHVVQSDTQLEAGTKIERVSLPADPLLGEPLAASYDDIDPYKGTAVSNASPSAVAEGTSGSSFHAWTAASGHAAFIDTWAPSHPVDGTGAFEVACPPPSAPPTDGTSSTAGSTNSPGRTEEATNTKQHKKHQHHQQPAPAKPARLTLNLTGGTTRARPSSVIAYRLTVANPGGSTARDVKVCDKVAAGQRVLRTSPSAVGKDETCWAVGSLAAGARRVLRVTAMVEPLAPAGAQLNLATATASNVKGVRKARATVRIAPLPETACSSASLARPLAAPRIAFRC